MKNNWNLNQMYGTSDLDFKNDISSLRIPVYVGWNVVGDPDDDRNFHIFAGPSAMIVTGVNSEDVGVDEEEFNRFIMGSEHWSRDFNRKNLCRCWL
jgi:hypothetical protein